MDIRHAPTETRDLVFRKIGDDISLTLESPAFIDSIPARALAVSNRFGLTFFVHAKGILYTLFSFLFSLHEFVACFIALALANLHDFALCALLLGYDEAMNGLFVLLLVSNG
jgi:hypothetical protein